MPRPSRWPHQMQADISTAQLEGLKAIAIREGLTPSHVVRRAIDREIALSTHPNEKDKEIA